jgi:hypothetical protein
MKNTSQNVERGTRNVIGLKGFFFSLFIIMAFVSPFFASAQVMIDTSDKSAGGTLYTSSFDGGKGSDNPKAANFQIVPCDGVDVPCDFKALVATFNRILKFLLYLSIPLVVGIILYTGFEFLTAGGDAMKLEKAKKMLIPVAIGIFWVLASWLVVNTILKTFLSDTTKAALNQNSEFQKLIK